VTRAVLRSIAVAALTLIVGGLFDLLHVVAFCPHRAGWVLTAPGRATSIESRYDVRGPDETVFLCRREHRLGPIRLHVDLICACVPGNVDPAPLDANEWGACTLDAPSGGDLASTVCQGRCDERSGAPHATDVAPYRSSR
jgi:hypothetical protein